MSKSPRKVLILCYKTAGDQRMIEAMNEENPELEITLSDLMNVNLYITDGKVSVKLIVEDVDAASFDLVYFKNFTRYVDLTTAIAVYLEKRDVKFIDKAAVFNSVGSKVYQYVILSDHGIKIPDSIFIDKTRVKDSFELFKEALGLPFVLKDIRGNKGKLNFLINDQDGLVHAALEAEAVKVSLIAQKYVDNEGDYRLIVLGDQLKIVISRQRANEFTHLNNVSRGGSFSQIALSELPKAVEQDAVKAANFLNIQVAGVDMVKDASGEWYCLEVNDGPQLATGALLVEKKQAMADFLKDYSS